MIDVDLMQDFIRDANPVPEPNQLDPAELARFVAMAEEPARTDTIEMKVVGRHLERRRGWRVAFATAGVALGLVAIAIVVAGPFSGGQVTDEVQPPAATSQPGTTTAVSNPAPLEKRLIPHPFENPFLPVSTAIGDLEFELLDYESSAYPLYRVSWTPHGLVAIESDRLYWSTDYYNWQSVDTSVPADSVTVVGEDIVVHGSGGTVRYGWDGAKWIALGALEINGVERLAFGQDGAVALVGTRLWYSTDGLHFNRAEEGPASRSSTDAERGYCPNGFGPLDSGRPVLATEAGYVTFTSKWPGMMGQHPMCEPIVWFSADGHGWELMSEESPFGESAAVYEIAERDGRFVAVGATRGASAVAWVSDDGLAWEPTIFDLDFVDGIAGGDLGWVLTGANAIDEQLMYFSADGYNWDGPYERPVTLNTGYLPPQITVGDDVIFGIGGSRMDVLLVRLQD